MILKSNQPLQRNNDVDQEREKNTQDWEIEEMRNQGEERIEGKIHFGMLSTYNYGSYLQDYCVNKINPNLKFKNSKLKINKKLILRKT